MPPMNDLINDNLSLIIQEGLDNSPDCFGILDSNDKLVFCNDTFASAYGISKHEALGKTNKQLLKLAWKNKKGIAINTNDFDLWYQKVELLHQKKKLNQFETDFTDGRWFQMTRTNLDNGYIMLLGVDISNLKETQNSLEIANKKIEELALTDQLTGVNNRRSLKYISNREIQRAKRYQQTLSVLMLDLDKFKDINDGYGHEAGDYVLRQFANLCYEQLRLTDSIFRVGGEEFAILLPMTDLIAAQSMAERLRLLIKAHKFYFERLDQTIDLTVSIGISSLSDDEQSFKDLMTQADKALYMAKRGGRNQVCIYST